MRVKKLTRAKISILNLVIPHNHIKDLWCVTYTGQRRWLSKHSFIVVVAPPPQKAEAYDIHYAYSGFRVLPSGNEILPTIGKDAVLRCHHCRHEKYRNFSKFTLEKLCFLHFLLIFLRLFLSKVRTTCLYPPWGRGSPLQNCLWFKRASHGIYVITEKAREDCIAAPLSQAGRVLPISLTNFGIN